MVNMRIEEGCKLVIIMKKDVLFQWCEMKGRLLGVCELWTVERTTLVGWTVERSTCGDHFWQPTWNRLGDTIRNTRVSNCNC